MATQVYSSETAAAPGAVFPDQTASTGVFLGSLLALARHEHYWSPAVLARTSWGALTNIGTGLEILRLLDFPPYAELAQRSSRFALKFLAIDFLVRGLTVAERASCFVHHYRRLRAVLPQRLWRQILQQDAILCEIAEGSNRFTVTMGLPKIFDKEGEMSINLLVNGEIVFVLSFAIVPGRVVKSEAADVLLISRLQGIRGTYRQIHLATKSLHDIAPDAVLLAAVQGVANAWGIGQLAAVGGTRQASYSEGLTAIFESSYDEFFVKLGMVRHPAGFFLSPIPMKSKPLGCIKQGHKLRTKEKRAFKLQIQLACRSFFNGAGA